MPYFRNIHVLPSLLMILVFVSGCKAFVMQEAPNSQFKRIHQTMETKKLLVFFDGTANEWNSRTNVRRLFELVASQESPNIKSLYIEGVGTGLHPLSGSILGYGMKSRILAGYKFLTKNYQPGNQIYIFGFSRGAHQARTLAGLLAYNGLPDNIADDKALDKTMEIIWDFCRHKDDLPYQTWKEWNGKRPIFTDDLVKHVKENHDKIQISNRVVEVRFLGIWDTVPGSQFKKYGLYGEAMDNVEGVRYKIQPYPAIKKIAHAVSLDEKRSKFRPVLVRSPIDPERTEVEEVWFPGAHSDVGGGYEDSNDLAGLSLNWMLDLLRDENLFNGWQPKVYADPAGLAHWSIDDKPGNAGSKYEDRFVPEGAKFDASISARKLLPAVPVKSNDIVKQIKYEPSYESISTQKIEKLRREYENNEE